MGKFENVISSTPQAAILNQIASLQALPLRSIRLTHLQYMCVQVHSLKALYKWGEGSVGRYLNVSFRNLLRNDRSC